MCVFVCLSCFVLMHDSFSGIKYDVNSTAVTGFIVPIIIMRLFIGKKYSSEHVFVLL